MEGDDFVIKRKVKDSKTSQNLVALADISYEDFFENFLKVNQPCLIKNVTLNWISTKYWAESNKPCFEYLKSKYGTSKIIAYNCNEKYFNSHPTLDMSFEEYIDYWRNYMSRKYSAELPLYYLKDWHLKNEFKNDNFYEVPMYFSSDWLNEYLTNFDKDDYRFVYMGPKGSWTPFHQDVFCSYSWSANICGKKKWILFPPGEENKVLDNLGNLPHTIQNIPKNVTYYEVTQDAGDAIFVPSGWHHQVWNLDDTISINHNWVNGCNIKLMWEALECNLCCVKKEISDCYEMENYFQQCQLLLKATFGMDFSEFFSFLHFIALKRLESISQTHEDIAVRKYLLFDLYSVEEVLVIFKEHKDLEKCPELIKLKTDASLLVKNIFEVINN